MIRVLVAGGAVLALVAAMVAIAGAAGAPRPANPLLAKWNGPYGGVPPFDKVKVEQLAPALEAGIAEQLAEIEKIVADSAVPTFENTIAAMERAGRTLGRVANIYGI